MTTPNCCKNCFTNCHLKEFIIKNYESIGTCDYCSSINVELYPVHKMGEHIRKCLDRAYEHIDYGTGEMWDSEEDEYVDYEGNPHEPVSTRDILYMKRGSLQT